MERKQQGLFALLSSGLEATLRDDNPWWRGERVFGLPRLSCQKLFSLSRASPSAFQSRLNIGEDIDHEDTRGLRSFMEKSHYNAPFGLLVTLAEMPGSEDPRIVSLPLSTLMLLR